MENLEDAGIGLVGVPVPRSRSSDRKIPAPVKRASSLGSLHVQGPSGDYVSIAGFTNELHSNWFFSVVGTEYCHTYFWIAKDIAWMQGWRRCSILFGLSALLWSFLILYHSLRSVNWHELWNFVALFLWLFSNYWWCVGEAHDLDYPHEPSIAEGHANQSACLLFVTLLFFGFFYAVIQPCDLISISGEARGEYDDGQLLPRLPWLDSFRQYENLHMLFWVSKDLAWNRMNFPLWVLSMVPTLAVSADLLYISASTNCEDSSVDVVHFVVVFIWVVGNSMWALGDFVSDNDSPIELLNFSWKSFQTPRWTSSWILLSTTVPLTAMYLTWFYLTLTGRLVPPKNAGGGGGAVLGPASHATGAWRIGTHGRIGGSGSGTGTRRSRRHFNQTSHSTSSNALSSLDCDPQTGSSDPQSSHLRAASAFVACTQDQGPNSGANIAMNGIHADSLLVGSGVGAGAGRMTPSKMLGDSSATPPSATGMTIASSCLPSHQCATEVTKTVWKGMYGMADDEDEEEADDNDNEEEEEEEEEEEGGNTTSGIAETRPLLATRAIAPVISKTIRSYAYEQGQERKSIRNESKNDQEGAPAMSSEFLRSPTAFGGGLRKLRQAVLSSPQQQQQTEQEQEGEKQKQRELQSLALQRKVLSPERSRLSHPPGLIPESMEMKSTQQVPIPPKSSPDNRQEVLGGVLTTSSSGSSHSRQGAAAPLYRMYRI